MRPSSSLYATHLHAQPQPIIAMAPREYDVVVFGATGFTGMYVGRCRWRGGSCDDRGPIALVCLLLRWEEQGRQDIKTKKKVAGR
jgi:hypothetical protein